MAEDLTVKDFWKQLDDDGKEYLIRRIHRDARLSIRRPEPIIDTGKNRFVRLDANADSTAATPPKKDSKKPSKPGKKPTVITLGSDSDDDAYAPAVIPGPGVVPRLDYGEIRKQLGFTEACLKYYEREIKFAYVNHLDDFRAQYGDLEAMLEGDDWKPYLKRKVESNDVHTQLEFKGFPLIEDVSMIAHPNRFFKKPPQKEGKIYADLQNNIKRDPGEDYTIDDGNCYFTAMALLLYGDARSWLRVKAEHLHYLEHVLSNKEHIRHEFYTRQNAIFSDTFATAHEGGRQWSGDVNLWEWLQIPNCWTSDEMCALTADVYGVFIVLYSFTYNDTTRTGNVYDMRTYGAFNSRHIFAAYYNRNHFVPLIPNNYFHYEFTLPRITLNITKRYNMRTSGAYHGEPNDGVDHYFRCSPRSIPGPLSYPGFGDELHLLMVVGYNRKNNAVSGTGKLPVSGGGLKPIQPGTTKPPAIVPTITIGDDLTGYIVQPTPPKPPAGGKPHKTITTPNPTIPGKVTTPKPDKTTTTKPSVIPVSGAPPPKIILENPGDDGVTFNIPPPPPVTPEPKPPVSPGTGTHDDPFTLDSDENEEDKKPITTTITPGKHKLDDHNEETPPKPSKKPKIEHDDNIPPPVITLDDSDPETQPEIKPPTVKPVPVTPKPNKKPVLKPAIKLNKKPTTSTTATTPGSTTKPGVKFDNTANDSGGKTSTTTTATTPETSSTSDKKKPPKIQDPTYKPPKDEDEDSDDEFPAFEEIPVTPKPVTSSTPGTTPGTPGTPTPSAPGLTKGQKWLKNKKKE